MKHPTTRRLIASCLFATLGVASLAPTAQAGHGRGPTNKYRRCDVRPVCAPAPYRTRVVEVHQSSGGGSTLAGFLGGLVVGAILSSAAEAHASVQAVAEPGPVCPASGSYARPYDDGYSYQDAYSHDRYSSLDLYMAHARHCSNDREPVVQVIDRRDGSCVDVIRERDGHWESCGNDPDYGWARDDAYDTRGNNEQWSEGDDN